MQISDEKKALRLVKPLSGNVKKRKTEGKKQKLVTGADVYAQQVEQYAQRIRETSDVGEIIHILDSVLGETRDLRYSNEMYNAQEQVRQAEKQIESLKLELEQLREQVHVDPMTGAFNRRGLDMVYAREAARADRNENMLCAVLIDLDNFKQINDSYGHQFGDEVLIQFVKTAKKSLRPSDVIARYGGEEFVILLPDTTTESVVWIMQRLQNNFSKHALADSNGDPVQITFSGGIADRRLCESQQSLLKRADEALYLAKNSGKNRVVVTPDAI